MGPFIKYTCGWGFYWEKSCNQFVLTTSHYYVIWALSWYAGFAVQAVFLTYLLTLCITPDDVPEEDNSIKKYEYKDTIIICMGLGLWAAMACLLSLGSLGIQYREEIVECVNQVFKLDEVLQKKFKTPIQLQNARSMERLIKLAVALSLVLPVGIGSTFFHPADPIRNILEGVLEVPLNIRTFWGWFFQISEIYCLLGFSNNAMSVALTATPLIYTCECWLDAAMPAENNKLRFQRGEQTLRTYGLGQRVSENTIFWTYRCLKILINMENITMEKLRTAVHYGVTMIGTAVVSFGICRCFEQLVADGSPAALVMLGVLLLYVFVMFLGIYSECYFLDGMFSKSRNLKDRAILASRRNLGAYKTAKSLMPITMRSVHPFLTVNIGTFADWSNGYVNRLVDILLTF